MIPLILLGQSNIQKPTSSLNDTTIVALIFAEHQKLSIENPLLREEISYLKEQNKICDVKDSLNNEVVKIYKTELSNTNKKLKKAKTSQKITFAGGIVLFLIGLIL